MGHSLRSNGGSQREGERERERESERAREKDRKKEMGWEASNNFAKSTAPEFYDCYSLSPLSLKHTRCYKNIIVSKTL